MKDDITLEGNQFLVRPLRCIKHPLKELSLTSISPSSSCNLDFKIKKFCMQCEKNIMNAIKDQRYNSLRLKFW